MICIIYRSGCRLRPAQICAIGILWGRLASCVGSAVHTTRATMYHSVISRTYLFIRAPFIRREALRHGEPVRTHRSRSGARGKPSKVLFSAGVEKTIPLVFVREGLFCTCVPVKCRQLFALPRAHTQVMYQVDSRQQPESTTLQPCRP